MPSSRRDLAVMGFHPPPVADTPVELSRRAPDRWIGYRIGYQPSFDGLRGVGILIVLLYHAISLDTGRYDILAGGYIWVDLFFVQSGFLITGLLLDEWQRTGAINLARFYLRRALRLLPALYAVCLVTVVWVFTLGSYENRAMVLKQVLSTVLYVNNWWYVHTQGNTSFYLGPAWSLSVEEQFYALIPLAVIFVLVRRFRPSRTTTVALGLGGLMALWMSVNVLSARHPVDVLDNLFVRTDTRPQGLFVGIALAFAAAGGLLFRTRKARRRIRFLGPWCFVAVLAAPFVLNPDSPRDYTFGFFLLGAIVFGVLHAYLLQEPHSIVARVLSQKQLVALGERLYGLYLWHAPVFLITLHYLPHLQFRWLFPIQLVAVLAVTEASWRWVETPFLRIATRFPRVDPERARAHARRLSLEADPEVES